MILDSAPSGENKMLIDSLKFLVLIAPLGILLAIPEQLAPHTLGV